MAYKGSISFGLVYIPIKLENAIQINDISFNQLEKNTMSRVRYKKTCDACGDKLINEKDIVKGYEYESGKYVIFEEADFEKIKSKRDKNIVIESFVDIDEIDPVYYDKPYYVMPTGAEKAFQLLLEALSESRKAGIAKAVLGTRQTLALVRVKNNEMLLNTMYFDSEIKRNPFKPLNEKISNQEKELAGMIIKNMTASFNPSDFKDEYNDKIRAAIDAKIAGQEIAVPKLETQGMVVDLMEALKASLGTFAQQ